MGLRDLIFEKKSEDKKPKKQETEMKFPTSTEKKVKPVAAKKEPLFSFPETTAPDPIPQVKVTETCEPYMDDVLDLYEKGFAALNKDGYDFYEYYKSVLEVGADNPATYKMALSMANTMDPSVSKTTLLDEEGYYTEEINKVHDHYQSQGEQKQASIRLAKQGEEDSLKQELDSVQEQMQALKAKEGRLNRAIQAIDTKYAGQLHEITCKLEANSTAKEEIFRSINKIKTGIIKNL